MLPTAIAPPQDPSSLAPAVQETFQGLDELIQAFETGFLRVLYGSYEDLATNMMFRWQKAGATEINLPADSTELFSTLKDVQAILQEFEQEQIPVIRTYLNSSLSHWMHTLTELVAAQPERIPFQLTEEALLANQEDGLLARANKSRLRRSHRNKGTLPTVQVRFRKVLESEISEVYFKNLLSFVHSIEMATRDLSHFLADQVGQRMEEGAVTGDMAFLDDEMEAFTAYAEKQKIFLVEYWKEFHALFKLRLHHELSQESIRSRTRGLSRQQTQILKELRDFGEHWESRQKRYHQHLMAEAYLLEVYAHLEELGAQIQAEVQARCFDPAMDDLKLLRTGLNRLEQAETTADWEEIQNQSFGGDNLLLLPDTRIMESAVARLRYLIDGLPGSLTMWQPREGRQPGRSLKVDLSETLSFLTKTYFLAPLETYFYQLPEQFKTVFYLHQDATRLISYNLTESGDEVSKADRQALVAKARTGYDSSLTKMEDLEAAVGQVVSDCLKQTAQYLHADALVQHARQWERNRRNQEAWQGFRSFRTNVQDWTRQRLDLFWRILGQTRSDLVLVSREQSGDHLTNVYTLIREFVEARQPSRNLLESLPFYYKQLFTGVQSINAPNIPNREAELTLARRAVKTLNEEGGGALLITGEALSGKSFFAEYVASHLFNGKVYRIHPPMGGSRKVSDLTTALQRSTGMKGSIQQILPRLQPGTVILFPDLELWWERSPEGMGALQRLLKMVDNHGRQLNFVAEVNLHAFRLLRSLTDLEGHFAATVNLAPLSAELLRKTVMERHYSGGGNLFWTHEPDDELSNRQLARLFRRYLRITGGNIGAVLRLWLGHIDVYADDKVFVREPEARQLPVMPDPDWEVLLSQLVLHKHMTYDKIQRVLMLGSKSAARRAMLPLLRTGLVQEVEREVLGINPYIYPYITQRLRENQIL